MTGMLIGRGRGRGGRERDRETEGNRGRERERERQRETEREREQAFRQSCGGHILQRHIYYVAAAPAKQRRPWGCGKQTALMTTTTEPPAHNRACMPNRHGPLPYFPNSTPPTLQPS